MIFGFCLLPLVQEYGLRSRPSAEELGVNGPNSDKAPLPTEEHPGPRQEQISTQGTNYMLLPSNPVNVLGFDTGRMIRKH
jgi:hypothetical protein